ncbi:MAG: Calcineurin-like phosphoesterase superfamily domain protein [Planctomycetota bacterium]|nr:Calcineurin-like phosphoesterase superfamily domain protein [Planctomycetota bacterium]
MRYGLLADIHEDVEFLRAGLDRLEREGVDRLIMLGDVFEHGRCLAETVAALMAAPVVGVWGNHDFGLCRETHDEVRQRFGPAIMAYFASLRPWLEFEDCLFTHVEPWRDAENLLDLWTSGAEELPVRSFSERSHRLMIHGHHHRWKVLTPDGRVAWDCFHPLKLDPDRRYVIEVGAVCDGRCGILDTGANLLIPLDLRDGD